MKTYLVTFAVKALDTPEAFAKAEKVLYDAHEAPIDFNVIVASNAKENLPEVAK